MVTRVFRTVNIKGQLYSNVMFLNLDVDVLIQLTYPETLENAFIGIPDTPYHSFGGQPPPKKVTGVTNISERVSPKKVISVSDMGETYTKNTYKDFNKDFSLSSYREVEDQIKRQIEYENLILDHPHDDRVGEILGLIVDVMTSSAEIIRVNREEKPANVVKAQFAKLTKEHVDFVLFRMDSNTTKARNIRAVLLTALYNAVNTMSSYYDNLYQYHIVEEMRGDERKKDV